MTLPYTQDQRRAIARAAGTAVARRRANADLSQDQVAEALGIGPEAVSRLERGVVELSVSRLVELAELFDCGLDELLFESSSRPADQGFAIAREIESVPAKEREALLGIVMQLAQILRGKRAR